MARLRDVQASASVPGEIFERLTADVPETLTQIAKAWRVPRGLFVEWYATEHAARYDAALKVLADRLAHEAIADANEADDRDSAAAARVKADTKLKVASKWDRRRYGESEEGRQIAPVVIQIAQLRDAPAVSISTGPAPKLLEEVPI